MNLHRKVEVKKKGVLWKPCVFMGCDFPRVLCLKKEVTNMAQAVNVNVDPFYSDQNMHYLKKLFVMSHKGKLILLNMN